MSLLSSHVLKRFAACLASGIMFAGTVGVGYRAGLSARAPRPKTRANEASGWKQSSSPEIHPDNNSRERTDLIGSPRLQHPKSRRLGHRAAPSHHS